MTSILSAALTRSKVLSAAVQEKEEPLESVNQSDSLMWI